MTTKFKEMFKTEQEDKAEKIMLDYTASGNWEEMVDIEWTTSDVHDLLTSRFLSDNEARKSVDSIDWLDESYVKRAAKECNLSLMYAHRGDYYDANVEDVVKFAQEIAKAVLQANL